ncbi:Uncharacterized protein TCM_019535 [Theobroma cacao]|uniref:Uncharacterized protein n=1 Tax=Theobroma cacao TaxID=3641 RepID=A0A061EPP5_THECC|nr:Uncharacterized protein TCM_019535 [Theobroma cacao]
MLVIIKSKAIALNMVHFETEGRKINIIINIVGIDGYCDLEVYAKGKKVVHVMKIKSMVKGKGGDDDEEREREIETLIRKNYDSDKTYRRDFQG